MAKSQKNQKNFKALLLGFMGLAGAGVAILLCLSRLGFSSEPVVEETLPPPENPYTESDFYVQDGFVYCSAVDAKTGIDVSSHQEVIDWATVAQSGVDYAMIRVGYRGYDQGGVHIDSYAEANLQGALDAGLPVGCTFTPRRSRSKRRGRKRKWFWNSLMVGKSHIPWYSTGNG